MQLTQFVQPEVHDSPLFEAENLPTAQLKQKGWLFPAGLDVPPSQSSHMAVPANFPSVHSMQSPFDFRTPPQSLHSLAFPKEPVPAGQLRHRSEPAYSAYMFTEQPTHSDAPADAKNPASHRMQFLWSELDALPASHLVQLVRTEVPACVEVYPSKQSEQDTCS